MVLGAFSRLYGPEQTLIYDQFSRYAPLAVVIWAYFHLKKTICLAGNWKSVSKLPEMRIFISPEAPLSPTGWPEALSASSEN